LLVNIVVGIYRHRKFLIRIFLSLNVNFKMNCRNFLFSQPLAGDINIDLLKFEVHSGIEEFVLQSYAFTNNIKI